MFGRVRASPLPVECLELERLPSKMLKDDCLSVYEATLMKLKQGSRRIGSSPDEIVDAAMLDHNKSSVSSESMCSEISSGTEGSITEISSEKSSNTQNNGVTYFSDSDSSISTTQEGRNMSIMYLFSKYNKQRSSYHLKGKGLRNDEVMDTEEEGSLTDDSSSFGDCETTVVLSYHT